jgi:hypothetical protein
MTADTLKSLSITNLDASPIVANTSPNGAKYDDQRYSDYVTPTTGGLADTTSTYKLVRVPTNCYLKSVVFIADAALDSNGSPTLAFDVGVYYSDSTTDGTPVALQGTVVSNNAIADNVLFGAAATLTVRMDAGKWTSANRQKRLWDALGLSSDPGGKFDIVATVEATAATAVSKAFTAEVTAILE